MRKIYKYPFQTGDVFLLKMPFRAKILCVQIQKGVPCLWAEVYDNLPLEVREFVIMGTGESFHLNCEMEYIGTYQESDGMLIWHVYEKL